MMKHRFLFCTTNGYGHWHPLIPLARALQAAGHIVAFAARPPLEARLQALGFEFFAVGGEVTDDPAYQAVKAELHALPTTLETELYAYPRLFGDIPARVRLPYLVEIVRAWQPEMVIREGGEYPSMLAAEYFGLPYATVAFAAALRTMGCFEQELAAQLDPVREQWGLKLDPDMLAPYRYLYLSYAPPTLATADVGRGCGGIPTTTHFIRTEFFDASGDEQLPAWVNELPPQPTVYATLGTEVTKEPEFYPRVMELIIGGLRDLPLNLIVTVGRDNDPAHFGAQPANVHIERYIPQSLLLPHCDLMVMHGGSNSLLAAIDVALPVVALPLIADQFFNAYATRSAGLGEVIEQDELTPEKIREGVEHVLENPLYRERARGLQAEMRALPDQSYAVELVERVADKGVSIVNTGLLGEPPTETLG